MSCCWETWRGDTSQPCCAPVEISQGTHSLLGDMQGIAFHACCAAIQISKTTDFLLDVMGRHTSQTCFAPVLWHAEQFIA